jgi:hypothetical protein
MNTFYFLLIKCNEALHILQSSSDIDDVYIQKGEIGGSCSMHGTGVSRMPGFSENMNERDSWEILIRHAHNTETDIIRTRREGAMDSDSKFCQFE